MSRFSSLLRLNTKILRRSILQTECFSCISSHCTCNFRLYSRSISCPLNYQANSRHSSIRNLRLLWSRNYVRVPPSNFVSTNVLKERKGLVGNDYANKHRVSGISYDRSDALSDNLADLAWSHREDTVNTAEGDFSNFNISPWLIAKLREDGINFLFPSQTYAFEAISEGKDVIIQARTGSGKTLSYVIPLIEKLISSKKDVNGNFPRVLVLAPTRELARQVCDVIDRLTSDRLSSVCVYGGASADVQVSKLNRGADVVVGTPGRVQDLLERGALSLAHLDHVVLDEVDRMLDMGFADDVDTIIKHRYVPGKPRDNPQTLLYSATVPSWVRQTAQKYLSRDVCMVDLIGSGNVRTATTVKHQAVSCRSDSLLPAVILQLLDKQRSSEEPVRAIVFCDTKRQVEALTSNRLLRQKGARALHGDIGQGTRERVLQGFREGHINLLIATDVAARGLDIPAVDLVVQCSVPKDTDSYIHRSGRTGRAGREGVSIVLYQPWDSQELAEVERKTGIKFEHVKELTTSSIISSSIEEAKKSIDRISPKSAAHCRGAAESLLMDGEEAADVLSRALAVICGLDNRSVDSEQRQAKLLHRNERAGFRNRHHISYHPAERNQSFKDRNFNKFDRKRRVLTDDDGDIF